MRRYFYKWFRVQSFHVTMSKKKLKYMVVQRFKDNKKNVFGKLIYNILE